MHCNTKADVLRQITCHSVSFNFLTHFAHNLIAINLLAFLLLLCCTVLSPACVHLIGVYETACRCRCCAQHEFQFIQFLLRPFLIELLLGLLIFIIKKNSKISYLTFDKIINFAVVAVVTRKYFEKNSNRKQRSDMWLRTPMVGWVLDLTKKKKQFLHLKWIAVITLPHERN